jgi:RNA polymerase sigma-70 factor (ECF subfamily)
LICELLPDEPENVGLLSLMLLQDSHRNARIDSMGELVTLEEQDRTLWDQNEIREGLKLIEQALRLRRPGPYQLQAAIAAVHAEARTAAETDWTQIAALYQELRRFLPSAIVDLNYAAAVAMAGSLDEGLRLVETSNRSGILDSYFSYHAARADLLRRLNRFAEARAAYSRALELTTNNVERKYVARRLKEL